MAITESIGKGKSTNSSKVNPKGPRTLPGGFPLDNGLKGVGHQGDLRRDQRHRPG